ncbi:MAG: hypothetical protein JSS72_01020 [Armatimonadetes bacterium]|nr:hypothetical protein [Armatimonadota bacterium]
MNAIAILGLLTAVHHDTVIPIEKCLEFRCDLSQRLGFLQEFKVTVRNISKRTLVTGDLSFGGGLWLYMVRDDGIETNYGLNHSYRLKPGESLNRTFSAKSFSNFKGSHRTVQFEYRQPDGYQDLDPNHVRLKGKFLSKKYDLTYTSLGIRVSTVK